MSKEIIEGNKLIAEFMGGYKEGGQYQFKHPSKEVHFREPEYHSSWDWLMPVVIKISLIPFDKSLGWEEEDFTEMNAYPYPRTFGMRDKEGNFMVRLNGNQLFFAKTLIEATWLAVTDFITWYNQQTT